MSNNMYFDTDSFDFSSLTDIVGLNDDIQGKSYGNEPLPRDEFAEAFDIPGSDDESHKDFNDDVSDILQGQDRSEHVSANQYFNALDDEAVLEFGGVELTKAQVKELYEAKHRIDSERGVVGEAFKSFDEGNKFIVEQLTRHQTVLDSNAAILEKRLNNPNLSEYDRGVAYKELQGVRMEQQQLNQRTNEIMNIRHEQEQQAIRHRIFSTDAEMTATHPQWSKYKGVILNSLPERGINPVELEKVWSPAIATALLESHIYRHNKKTISEAAKANASTTKHATSAPSVNQSRNPANNADKAKKDQALKNMGSSRQANAAAFAFLKD